MPFPPITPSPALPARDGTQTPAQFSDAVDAFNAWQVNDLQPDLDDYGAYLDATAVTVEANKVIAQNSANTASQFGNYAGVWSSLTGSLAANYSVYHKNGLWGSLVAIADITASEPSSTNDDWVFLSGNRWTAQVTASFTAGRNQMIPIYAASAAVDITQPTFIAGDFLIIHNSQSSTETVRLLNPSNSIVGSSTVSAGDNIILAAGDTMHLYARTSTILEVIYYG